MDVQERLEQLEKLRREGAISDEEYLQQKAMIEDERATAEKIDALAEEAARKAADPKAEEIPQPKDVGAASPAPTPAQAPANVAPPDPALVGAPTKTPMQLAEERERRANIAMIIEVLGGLFGLLGLGYLYAGEAGKGLFRLVSWIIVVGLMWTVVAFLAAIVVGVCLIPFALAAQIAVPIWSGLRVKALIMSKA